MRWSRRKTWWTFAIVALFYLIGHEFIFSKQLAFRNIYDFIAKGKEHLWHVAPVIIAFLVLFVADRRDRRKKSDPEQE